MRRIVVVVALSLLMLQSSPVSTQPFGPFPRPPVVLNGCSESALFAVLNSDAGKECLRTLLPRFGNVASDYSVFCSGARWGCCTKANGLGSCKIEGLIPLQRTQRPPLSAKPG